MKIAVAGTGYVGLSIATLLAQHNRVVAVDIVPEKVDLINARKSPICDKEIEEYLGQIETIAECVVLGRKMNEESDEITLTALVYPQMDKFDRDAETEVIEETIRGQINKMNHKLVSYKQIRGVEFRYEPFEKTTSKKIKRHLVH